jgi:hypothetical protein
VATCDGVRMGINDVEILNARNYFIGNKDGARTARRAPSPTGGGGCAGSYISAPAALSVPPQLAGILLVLCNYIDHTNTL